MTSVVETWKEFGSLINTGLMLITLVGVISTASIGYNNLSRDTLENSQKIEEVAKASQVKWDEHGVYHRERAEDNTRIMTSLAERVNKTEESIRKLDRLSDRVTTTDANLNALAQSVKELVSQFNTYSGDLREVKVILQRIEQAQRSQR